MWFMGLAYQGAPPGAFTDGAPASPPDRSHRRRLDFGPGDQHPPSAWNALKCGGDAGRKPGERSGQGGGTPMTQRVLGRLVRLVGVYFGVLTLTFALRPVAGGDPVEALLFGQPSSPETVANLRASFGLDQP